MIEAITHADIPILVEMARSAHAESRYAHYPFSPDMVQRTLIETIREPRHLAVKAVIKNQIAGFFLAEIMAMIFTARPVGREICFYVRPESRGTRCGLILISTFLRWCERNNVPAFTTVHFQKDNERTYKLLQRLGMTELGRLFGKDY